MPSQNRLRRDDRREPTQQTATERHASNGEATAVGVGEAEPPSPELALEDPVFFQQVVEDALLVAVEPAGEDDGEDL